MTVGQPDRRIHADALRRLRRRGQVQRFKRQAAMLLAGFFGGALGVPFMALTPTSLEAAGTYYRAAAQAQLMGNGGHDPRMVIRYAGADHAVSAHAVAAHPYYHGAATVLERLAAFGGLLGLTSAFAGSFLARGVAARRREERCTLADLLHALQVRDKDDLKQWLAGTSSARTFAEDADRATGSVLFMLAKAANLIQFLRAEDSANEPFSFRHVVHGRDVKTGARPWIFVPRKEDYFEASKPLLACWLECAASAVLGLAPAPERRIWFILDELADLPRVDNLARLLPEGRKFGAAVVLTFQALGQMRHRYGPQLAESMLGCCNTKLFLQSIDSETRQWASRTIGSQEVEIGTMSDTLGEGNDKPRTSLSAARQTRPAVAESELRLPKFEAYLLLPDGMPVARITLGAAHLARRGPPRAPAFVAGDPAQNLWSQSPVTAPPPQSAPADLPPAPPPATRGPV